MSNSNWYLPAVGTRVVVNGLAHGTVVGHGAATPQGSHWDNHGTRTLVLVDVGTFRVPAHPLGTTGLEVSVLAVDPSVLSYPDGFDEPTWPGVDR